MVVVSYLNLGDILNNAFGYAKKMLSDIGRLVILIILHVIPIVNFIVVGYYAKAVRESPTSCDVPKLEGYGDMFMQGLKVAVAVFLYMVIPMILIFAGAAFLNMPWMMMRGGYGYNMGMWALSPFGIILIIAGIVVAFFVAIIAAIGIVHMIKLNSFGKAFAFGHVLGIIGKTGWPKYIGWIIVMFIIGAIVGLIGAIPYVGWLISIIISPIYGVFAARSAALIYTEGAPESQYPPPPTAYPTPPPTAVVGTSCKFCGAPKPAGATYCINCGQKIE